MSDGDSIPVEPMLLTHAEMAHVRATVTESGTGRERLMLAHISALTRELDATNEAQVGLREDEEQAKSERDAAIRSLTALDSQWTHTCEGLTHELHAARARTIEAHDRLAGVRGAAVAICERYALDRSTADPMAPADVESWRGAMDGKVFAGLQAAGAIECAERIRAMPVGGK